MTRSTTWQRKLGNWLAGDEEVLALPQSAALGEVLGQLEAAGYEAVQIDFAPIVDKAGLMSAMRAALALDAWFGANWDALGDALFGPEDPDAPDRVLLLCLPPDGPALPEADFLTLLQIIEDVAGSSRSTLKGAILLGGSPFGDWPAKSGQA